MDVTYTYGTTEPAVSGGVGIVMLLVYIAIIVIAIVANWKIFTKAGKPGWHCLIPFLNLYDIFEIAGMNGLMFLLLFIPFVNFVIMIMLMINLAKAFGKGIGFAIGLILLSGIFTLILAFGSAQYVGNRK